MSLSVEADDYLQRCFTKKMKFSPFFAHAEPTVTAPSSCRHDATSQKWQEFQPGSDHQVSTEQRISLLLAVFGSEGHMPAKNCSPVSTTMGRKAARFQRRPRRKEETLSFARFAVSVSEQTVPCPLHACRHTLEDDQT